MSSALCPATSRYGLATTSPRVERPNPIILTKAPRRHLRRSYERYR
ncbi:hypothetical protein SNOG_13020 [Parastagonospora nodorum SN15]|uniref:Uncharacterized protein n=1 Tax=Phaeosphaeria nodorum (strain SN15 / ATCC MYA-4574 / FGSC 10173) TaxID=321614 RepID=Q0U5E4_PHANO|nr:hypothetical protein SNOG_13020 [Parastagonospora nodorum SN15]EAT79820.1 hypothetical protein SNOG_13020 [Parastagonospora nodorum SN15]